MSAIIKAGTGTLLPLVLVLAAVVAGCAQPPLPKDHFYRLRVETPARLSAAPLFQGTLEIGPFAADGLTAGRPIVYSDSRRPHELSEYHYHFWTEPPAVMLRDQLVDYLRAAGVASNVVTPEMRIEPDYVIAARIKRLEQVVGSPPRASIELELGLRRTADDRLLFVGTYGLEVEAGDDTVGATVVAANLALGRIYRKFVLDISGI